MLLILSQINLSVGLLCLITKILNRFIIPECELKEYQKLMDSKLEIMISDIELAGNIGATKLLRGMLSVKKVKWKHILFIIMLSFVPIFNISTLIGSLTLPFTIERKIKELK